MDNLLQQPRFCKHCRRKMFHYTQKLPCNCKDLCNMYWICSMSCHEAEGGTVIVPATNLTKMDIMDIMIIYQEPKELPDETEIPQKKLNQPVKIKIKEKKRKFKDTRLDDLI